MDRQGLRPVTILTSRRNPANKRGVVATVFLALILLVPLALIATAIYHDRK